MKRYEATKKRLDLIFCFSQQTSWRLDELQLETGYSFEGDTSKAIKKINSLFREKVDQLNDLIIHTDSSGYRLNKAKYNFEFLE